MSKARIKRLGFVLDMAEKQERERLQTWGRYQTQQQQEKDKYDQLDRYLQEYRGSFASIGSEHPSLKGGQIQNTIAFIEQLKVALGHQQAQINVINQQLEGAKKVYLSARSKASALRKLIEKLTQKLNAEDEKQLQKLMDEFSARSALKNRQ